MAEVPEFENLEEALAHMDFGQIGIRGRHRIYGVYKEQDAGAIGYLAIRTPVQDINFLMDRNDLIGLALDILRAYDVR